MALERMKKNLPLQLNYVSSTVRFNCHQFVFLHLQGAAAVLPKPTASTGAGTRPAQWMTLQRKDEGDVHLLRQKEGDMNFVCGSGGPFDPPPRCSIRSRHRHQG